MSSEPDESSLEAELLSLSDSSSGRSSSSSTTWGKDDVGGINGVLVGTSTSLSLSSEEELPVESHPTRSGMSSSELILTAGG
jgi:hypothetical protein